MNNLQRREHVDRQLERRREVLAEWVEIGFSKLPEGTRVPSSLNQVRLWDEPCLGISKIGSPASFTTTHPVHGAAVRDIAGLLRELADQRAALGKAEQARATKRERWLAVLERSLVGAANRYVVLRVELDETKLRLRVAEQSVAAFKHENGELRHLKAALPQRPASSTITPIDSRRRPPP